MKKLLVLQFFTLLILYATSQESDFLKFLQSEPDIQSIEKIEGNDIFSESYKIMFRQPVDHSDPSAGYFNQRIFVSHISKEAPVVLITEGYVAAQAHRSAYASEPARLLGANQVDVEHRYFGESWPENIGWQYLTVANAAADHHRITGLFKKYYSGKWVNTGISKGGQTAMYHRAFYPDDVDVTLAYVGPLNFGVEDGRHEPFIANVPGTAEQRAQIEKIQTEVLKRKKVLFPRFLEEVQSKNFTFRLPITEIYDYCVLEYPFAFWQYGINPEQLPSPEAPDSVLYKHLFGISSPDYMAIESMARIKSFYVQAARELGYYGYDTKPFKKYLDVKSAKGYLSKIFLPEGMKIKYNKATMQKVQEFLDTTDKNMIFIYGEFDPWSATAVEVPEKPNLLKIVNPGGAHSSRIGNLPDDLKEKVLEKLEMWMEVPAEVNQ